MTRPMRDSGCHLDFSFLSPSGDESEFFGVCERERAMCNLSTLKPEFDPFSDNNHIDNIKGGTTYHVLIEGRLQRIYKAGYHIFVM